ncbi:MAG TPA: hypothetical protein PK400_13535, partial [Phycisphaerales bacterium]|nr:hypothetical protein [Phycisphaerales bacterium]
YWPLPMNRFSPPPRIVKCQFSEPTNTRSHPYRVRRIKGIAAWVSVNGNIFKVFVEQVLV